MLTDAQTDLRCMFLILKVRICCRSNVEACFHSTFYNYQFRWNKTFFAIFSCFFFLFSKRKDKFSSFAFIEISIFIYCVFPVTETNYQSELRIEKKKNYLAIENLLLRIMHFPDGTYSFKVNTGNTTKICEICSKLSKRHQNDFNDG